MRNLVSTYIERFRHEKRLRASAITVLIVLATLVVTAVFWQLRHTGLAMANEYSCGYEEHIHDDSCYALELTCEEETKGVAEHVHDSSCCEAVQTLICDLEESDGEDGHIHDDSCYTTEEVLICGLEETGATHVHDDSCYASVPVCEIPEHIHSVACLIDEEADVETSGDWEATLPEEIPEDWAEAVVAVAESQVGYAESVKNFRLSEDGEVRNGYTRYGEWYGNPYGDWDAMFAGFCLCHAGVPEEAFPRAAGAWAWIVELEEPGLYADAAEAEPAPGDLVFLDTDEDGAADTVAIVTAVGEDQLTVIQGDCDDAVCEIGYDPEDGTIVGYGLLPENPVEDERTVEPSETVTYKAGDGGVSVEVAVSEEALPDGAALVVTLCDEQNCETPDATEKLRGEEAEWYSEETAGNGEAAESFTFSVENTEKSERKSVSLDISFLLDGEEVEPTEPSDVTIDASALLDESADEIAGFEVWHFEKTEDGTKPVLVALDPAGDEIAVAAFTVESFSQFTFEWWPATGHAELGVNLYDSDGGALAGKQKSSRLAGNDGFASSMADFSDDYIGVDGKFVYATLTDPNFGDTDHTFDADSNVGVQGTYGSEANPIVEISISPEDRGETSRTWIFTLTYENGGEDVISIYGNQNGAADASGKYCPKTLELNLYYEAVGNGVVLDSRSSGGNYGGRDTVFGLSQYADKNGDITITLPDNAHLGSDFVVYEDKDTGGTVTVNASKISKDGFDWRVVGWFNIATGEYVNVSEGPATTTVNLNENFNVFYADLVAASYDAGTADDGNVIESDMTGDFVTVKLFDYNDLFNLYSSELVQNGMDSEVWDAGITPFAKGGSRLYPDPVLDNSVADWYSAGKAVGRSFLFTNDGWGAGNLGYPYDLNSWNEWTGNSNASEVDENGNLTGKSIRYQLTSAAFNWNVTSRDSGLLQMLFDESGNTYGVHYIGEADGLFQFGGEDDELHIVDNKNSLNNQDYDFNGYYYYTSAQNAASYSQSEGRFYLHDGTEGYNGYTMFLPFNPYKGSFGAGEIDYWFGMEMEVDFYLPGATGENAVDDYGNRIEGTYVNTVAGEEMQFFFTGDDDIMVFVDDRLVLDMAGIHDEAVGRINFATGEYYYHCLDQVDGTAGGDEITGTLNLKAGTHTLTVYYLERGAGASNLTVSFNIMPSWHYYAHEIATVTAEKEWADGNESHAEDAVSVGLFEEVFPSECVRAEQGDGSVTYTVTSGDDRGKTYTFSAGSNFAFDEDGDLVALLDQKTDDEGGDAGDAATLYVLLDRTAPEDSGTQELNADNSWYFAWELLDRDRTYRVMELEGPEGYTVTSSSTTFDTWQYWSIIGESELEQMYARDEEEHWVILTDAAASWNPSDGYPVRGNVVKNNISAGVARVIFSEAPLWFELREGEISAEFGEIPDSQISGKNLRWKVEFTGDTALDEGYGNKVHTFYLVSEGDGGQYIYVSGGTLRKGYLTNITPTAFYVDDLGELRVDGTDQRVVYAEDASTGRELQVVDSTDVIESGNNDIRLYTLSDTDTWGTAYTFVNAKASILPDTGGGGTALYTGCGLALMTGAAWLIVNRRRVKR